MSASHAARFVLPQATADEAERIGRALSVESKAVPPGTRVEFSTDGSALVLSIEASDARSLRAAVNSFLRLVVVAQDVSGSPNA